MITLLNRLAHKYKSRGGVLARLWDIAMELCWIEKIVVFMFGKSKRDVSDASPIVWRTATDLDVLNMAQAGDMGIDAKDPAYHLSLANAPNGMVVGELDGTVVAYGCFVVGRKKFAQLAFRLDHDEAFLLALYTRSAFRGQGLATQAIAHCLRLLGDRGYRTAYIDISTSNTASLRAAQKARAVDTHTVCYRVRLLKHDFSFPRGCLKSRFVPFKPKGRRS